MPYGWEAPAEVDKGTAFFPFCPRILNGITPGLEYPLSFSLTDLVNLYHRVRTWSVVINAAPFGGGFGGTMDGLINGVWTVMARETEIACCTDRRIDLNLTAGTANLVFSFYFCATQDFTIGFGLDCALKDGLLHDVWWPQMSVDCTITDPTVGYIYGMSSSNRGNTGAGIPSAVTLGIDGYFVPAYQTGVPDFPAGSSIIINPLTWWEYRNAAGLLPVWDAATGGQLITPVPYGM